MEFIFGRDEETQEIREKLSKTVLSLFMVPRESAKHCYCAVCYRSFPDSFIAKIRPPTQTIFRSLAQSLVRLRNRRTVTAFRDEDSIKAKSAVSLKGIVMEALNQDKYCIASGPLEAPFVLVSHRRCEKSWGGDPLQSLRWRGLATWRTWDFCSLFIPTGRRDARSAISRLRSPSIRSGDGKTGRAWQRKTWRSLERKYCNSAAVIRVRSWPC